MQDEALVFTCGIEMHLDDAVSSFDNAAKIVKL